MLSKPRFTLRDLFWLTLVVALALGWWVHGVRMERQSQRLKAGIAKIYEDSLPGQLLEDVIQQHKLEQTPVWHVPNSPPGEPIAVVYFLPLGDLYLELRGNPATIQIALFSPSDKSAAERYQAMGSGWSDWVEAHSK